jgi:polyribonucleotide nucleotidyltransferase
LFPDDFHAETFVNVSLISADPEIMPDSLAGLAASSALAVSDVPFNGPISEVRVARINGQLKLNPTFSELGEADLDIIVGATIDNILMVEGEMNEVSEKEMLEAMKFAHEEIKRHCKVQMELSKEVGKTEKREYSHETNDETLEKLIWDKTYKQIYNVVKNTPGKQERHDALDEIKDKLE